MAARWLCTQHSVFPESKEGCNLRRENRELQQEDRQVPNVTCPETTVDSNRTWLARATENISVPPRCRQIVIAKLEAKKSQDLPPLVGIEPAQIQIEGIHTARGLSRTSLKTIDLTPRSPQSNHTDDSVRKGCSFVMVTFSNEELIVPKATVLRVAEEMTGEVVEKTNSEGKERPSSHNPAQKKKRNEDLYRKLLRRKLNHLTENEKKIKENLKPRPPRDKENLDQHCRLGNLKASLRLAYETVKQANKQSYLKSKRSNPRPRYDRSIERVLVMIISADQKCWQHDQLFRSTRSLRFACTTNK